VVERVPIPEGWTAADFLAIVAKMKLMRRKTKERRILLALAKGYKHGVWVRMDGVSRRTAWEAIYAIRGRGFIVDTTSPHREQTWRTSLISDVGKEKGGPLTKAEKNRWPDRSAVYRLNPEFMRAFRVFLRNYRLGGGFVINRWESNTLSHIRDLLRSLQLDKRGCERA